MSRSSWIKLASFVEGFAEDQFLWCEQQALKLPITTQEVAGILRLALGNRAIAELLLEIWAESFTRGESSAQALMHCHFWAYARKPNLELHRSWLRSSPKDAERDFPWLILAADCDKP